MVFYPILLLVQFPINFERILQLFNIYDSDLNFFSYYLVALQGLFDSIIYGKYSNFTELSKLR
jgi:hypothetical protein